MRRFLSSGARRNSAKWVTDRWRVAKCFSRRHDTTINFQRYTGTVSKCPATH